MCITLPKATNHILAQDADLIWDGKEALNRDAPNFTDTWREKRNQWTYSWTQPVGSNTIRVVHKRNKISLLFPQKKVNYITSKDGYNPYQFYQNPAVSQNHPANDRPRFSLLFEAVYATDLQVDVDLCDDRYSN